LTWTVVTIIAGNNPQRAAAEYAGVQAAADDIHQRFVQARQALVREYGERGKQGLALFDAGRQTSVGWGALSNVDTWTRELRRIEPQEQRLAKAAQLPATPDAIRIVVIGGFEHKDMLKSRGYRFDRDAHWADVVGMQTAAGWWFEIPATKPEVINNHLAWLAKHGEVVGADFWAAFGAQIRAEVAQ